MKPKKKIVFADATAIEALGPYVDDVLEAIGDVFRITPCFVSDESNVSDFMEHLDATKDQEMLAKLAERLGVKVEIGDRIYEVARRLRDK